MSKHGGAREGAGRKKLENKKSVVFNFKTTDDNRTEIKDLIKKAKAKSGLKSIDEVLIKALEEFCK